MPAYSQDQLAREQERKKGLRKAELKRKEADINVRSCRINKLKLSKQLRMPRLKQLRRKKRNKRDRQLSYWLNRLKRELERQERAR